MWNCGRIKFHIENMAKDYGISVVEIDEYETSQIHYDTQNYGYRDENNAEILWYKDVDGEVKPSHADKNAAINIAMRFLSQHTNTWSFPIVLSDNNQYEINYSGDAVRMKGSAYKNFKDPNIKFDINNICDIDKNGNPCNKTRVCKVDGEWVGKNIKKIYVESLKTLVLKSYK